MPFNAQRFAEKYQLARETAMDQNPSGGLNGFELEWNLLDEHFRPLLTVGSGPAQQSFVDYLRAECLPPWLRGFSQLEVFHWMVEWATRPYYTPRGAVYEARLMEAVLANSLARAGEQFGERLFYWHGNLLFLTAIGHDSIPERGASPKGDTWSAASTCTATAWVRPGSTSICPCLNPCFPGTSCTRALPSAATVILMITNQKSILPRRV